jgi:hypothetical protein
MQERSIWNKFNEIRQDNPRKTRIQFGNTKIWYVPIRKISRKYSRNFQPTLKFNGFNLIMP